MLQRIDPNTMVDNAQYQLNKAMEWGAQNGLTFCADKTTVVFFTRKYNFVKKVLPKVKKIKINGVEIDPSTSMTYLGIILDHKLNWSVHIKNKVSKAIKFLAMIKPAILHIYIYDFVCVCPPPRALFGPKANHFDTFWAKGQSF